MFFCGVKPFTFFEVVYSFCNELHKIILATLPNLASVLVYFLSHWVKKQNKKAFILYVNFKRAFDSIHRARMQKNLKTWVSTVIRRRLSIRCSTILASDEKELKEVMESTEMDINVRKEIAGSACHKF